MGFQTSVSRCILPSPEQWHHSKPQFYQTGHEGIELVPQLGAIKRPERSVFPISGRFLYVPYVLLQPPWQLLASKNPKHVKPNKVIMI